MSQLRRLGGLALATLMLAGCGLFGDEEDEALLPAELLPIDEKIDVRKAWSTRLGSDTAFLRLALRPAGDGNRIYAASYDGAVAAFEPASGERLWRVELDDTLTAGPGVGDGLVAVAAADGTVYALDAATGDLRWQADVNGESLATPAVGSGVVIVQTVDNRLRALEIFDGSERWVTLQSMPALTVRGTSTPVLQGSSNVVAGFDNGRLLAINLDTGDAAWDTMIALPDGRSDLERLNDIDGAIAVVGQDVYAAGYQGRIAAVAAESGQMLWATEVSSVTGVAADWNSLYSTLEDSVIVALSRRNGAESWRQDALLRREATLPVPFNTTVVSGDFEGYLHFFSSVDGTPLARERVGGAVTVQPVVVANHLYVQSDDGTLTAFVIQQPERPANQAPDIADDEGA